MAATLRHHGLFPLLAPGKACHVECFLPLPRGVTLGHSARGNPEGEHWLGPSAAERDRLLRELAFYRDYRAPLSAGASLG